MDTNFHASGASRTEEDFYMFLYLYGSNPGHPTEDSCKTLRPLFEQIRFLTTRQGYIPKQLSLAVLEKEIFKYIYLLTQAL